MGPLFAAGPLQCVELTSDQLPRLQRFLEANSEYYLAEGVWHIGLFIVATSLHGSGTAQALYAELESWMRARGGRWARLGVVEGNVRTERFWERMGYVEVRRRLGVEMGNKISTLRVMAKPLGNCTLSEYLGVVARDRPESP